MVKKKENRPQDPFEAARACLERICPPEQAKRRAGAATSRVHALADYHAYLSSLEQTGNGATGCRGLHGQLADRAFEAESNVRMLLAEGVDSLNELRDSGMLHASLRQFAAEIGSGKIDLAASVRESVQQVKQSLDLPEAFANELLRFMEQHPISVRYDRKSETLVVRKEDDADAPAETRIRIAPRAGDLGRIDLETFFGPSGSVSVQRGPRAGGGDCHRPKGEAQPLHSVDAYSTMLGALAASREAFYGHARKASQYGHGTELRARDPAVVGLVLVGIALTVFVVAFIVALVSGGVTVTPGGGISFPIVTAIAAGIAAVGFVGAVLIEIWWVVFL